MENLFAHHKPKRGMVCLTMVGSLMVHGALVGIGSLWTPAQPEDHSVVIIEEAPPEGPRQVTDIYVLAPNSRETPEATAKPEEVDVMATPPPLTESPELFEPSERTPPSRPTTPIKPSATANHPAVGHTVSHNSAGPSAGGTPGGVSGPAATVGAWVMPHPPYPRVFGRSAVTGQTTVRITTDASGRVSNVVIVQSTGNPALDSHTLNYVRNNWRGPANASRTTQFVYELR